MITIVIDLDRSTDPPQYLCQFKDDPASKVTHPSKDDVLTGFLSQHRDAIKDSGGFNVEDNTR